MNINLPDYIMKKKLRNRIEILKEMDRRGVQMDVKLEYSVLLKL